MKMGAPRVPFSLSVRGTHPTRAVVHHFLGGLISHFVRRHCSRVPYAFLSRPFYTQLTQHGLNPLLERR